MIPTALTRMFELEHPLILGPMGGVAGGRLAAAVSNAGGLGLVGAGYGDPQWVARELDLVGELSHRPWGIGFITWSTAPELLELALARKPAAVMLSFGDPRPLGARIKAAGCRLICQVQDLAGARLAHEAGADLVVAQGTEAGGHASRRATLPLVPAVANLVAPIP
ncbi:MAG: nitronate monooxygenase, partial [Burkholderiales bacterium]|nr:nitronate monooxygenase [Burkholderiales bacterium]